MLNIVFLGTPDFAVPCLCELFHAGHRLRLVVTQPDRPKGRGRKTVPPPVKAAAEKLGLPVLQPSSIREEEALGQILEQQPDVLVVVAFGQILPQTLIAAVPMGAVNVHASLLPRLRGPAPIQWAVIRGENETGVTTMQMDTGIDTGLCVHRFDHVRNELADLIVDDLHRVCRFPEKGIRVGYYVTYGHSCTSASVSLDFDLFDGR